MKYWKLEIKKSIKKIDDFLCPQSRNFIVAEKQAECEVTLINFDASLQVLINLIIFQREI